MTQFRQLLEYIVQQLCDAKKYAQKSLYYKQEDKDLSQLYYKLSHEQLQHSDKQYTFVANHIIHGQNQDNPHLDVMKVIWNWQNKSIIKKKAQVLQLLSMCK